MGSRGSVMNRGNVIPGDAEPQVIPEGHVAVEVTGTGPMGWSSELQERADGVQSQPNQPSPAEVPTDLSAAA